MIKADDEQLHSVIAIALLRQQEADEAHERMLRTLETIEKRALESEKSLKDLMGQYINRLYEEAVFHQNEQGKRLVVIWCCVTAGCMAGLLVCVGFWGFIFGEKNEQAKAPVPAAVQVAPAPAQEVLPKPHPLKKHRHHKPAPATSPDADAKALDVPA